MPVDHEDPCTMMRRTAKESREAIKQLRKRIDKLTEDIAVLKQQAHPDQQAIAALERQLADRGDQLASDELSLSTLEDVISENC